MTQIRESIEVEVPVSAAYDQWSQFEEFPRFMEGVERVVQLDDTTLEWTARVAGRAKSWRARITDQAPDEVIAWVATEGARNDGTVLFEPLGPSRTRIDLVLEVEPDNALEQVGASTGFVSARVKGDMLRFRSFIESRGGPTGAWRGEVRGGQAQDPRSKSARLGSVDPAAVGLAFDSAGAVDTTTGQRFGAPADNRPTLSAAPGTATGMDFGTETDFGEGSPPTPETTTGMGFGTETDFGEGSPPTPETAIGMGFGTETDFGEGSPPTPETAIGMGFGTETDFGEGSPPTPETAIGMGFGAETDFGSDEAASAEELGFGEPLSPPRVTLRRTEEDDDGRA